MKSQQQARARASARRKGWLGIAAATALLATSMGGTMLAFAADGVSIIAKVSGVKF